MAGALIVTAALAAEDFAWLDGLRRRHYPAERNRVPAHLTIFHALPPSAEDVVRRALSSAAARKPPQAGIAGVMDLGGGVALLVVSEELDAIRHELAGRLHGLLGPQDSHGWRPHVTIQNKVSNREAQELFSQMRASFLPRPLGISGLELHRYLDGPWEKLGGWRFR